MDELDKEGGIQARLIATCKGEDGKELLKAEFAGADNLLKRCEPLIRDLYKTQADKEFDINATNYAVQVAMGAGYRKALRDVYRLLYPEV